MKTYKTAEVAQIIGIHPNTVRLYEKCKLISPPKRLNNGYRIFSDLHIEQFHLARAALKVEVLQNGLRKQAVDIIKTVADKNWPDAKKKTQDYLHQIEVEMCHGEEAIKIVQDLLSGSAPDCPIDDNKTLTRKETAKVLQITIDTLRNWELNGLITVKRHQNGYRIYSPSDLQRLKIIRSLRCANYSLSAILRMLQALSINPKLDLREVINTPLEEEDVITACDKLLTSLMEAKNNALFVMRQIEKMELMSED